MTKKKEHPAIKPATKQEIELMIRYRKQGMSYDRIAETVGVSRNTVRKHASFGETRRTPAGAAVARERFTARQIEIAVAAAEYRGANRKDVA